MADTAKRMYGPAEPSTSNDTSVYTVPGSTTAIVRNIHVSNPTGSAATLTISVGNPGSTATSADLFLEAFSIPAGNTYDWSGFLVLAAAEKLYLKQGTANALTVIVSGVEVT